MSPKSPELILRADSLDTMRAAETTARHPPAIDPNTLEKMDQPKDDAITAAPA